MEVRPRLVLERSTGGPLRVVNSFGWDEKATLNFGDVPKDIRTDKTFSGQLQINQTDFWSLAKPIWDTSDVLRDILSFGFPDVIICLFPSSL